MGALYMFAPDLSSLKLVLVLCQRRSRPPQVTATYLARHDLLMTKQFVIWHRLLTLWVFDSGMGAADRDDAGARTSLALQLRLSL